MYLSDRDLKYAIECGKLVCTPAPTRIDATSIDLHLDAIKEAKIWDIEKFQKAQQATGKKCRASHRSLPLR